VFDPEELRGKTVADIQGGTPEEVRNKTPEELRNLIEVIDAHLRSLHQTDTGELRDLDDAEQSAFNYGIAIREAALARIENHRKVSDVFARRPEAVKRAYAHIRNGLDDVGSVARMSGFEARDAALRKLDDRSSAYLRDDEKVHVEQQVRRNPDVARRIIVTENDAYRSAWMKAVTDPRASDLFDDEERNAMRAYAEYRAASSSSGSGGYGVPVERELVAA